MSIVDYSKFCSYSIGIPEKYEKPVNYCLTGSGAKEIRENEIGIFIVTPNKVAGLEPLKEGFTMKLPKIPVEILFQIIGFFKEVNRIYSSEAIIQIYWDKTKQEYYCYCPRQEVSGASVDFKRNNKKDKNLLLIADIHSHNSMGSFFSGIDDRDEKETRLFGVIGNIEDDLPDVKLRASSGSSTVDVDLTDIFQINEEFPKEWLTKIKIKEKEEYKYNRCIIDQAKLWEQDRHEYITLKNDDTEQKKANESREKVDKIFDNIMDELMPEEIEDLTDKLLYCYSE